MHHLDIYNGNKPDISEIDLLLMMEMGFFSDLKRMQIRFNPRPFSNPTHLPRPVPPQRENVVDLHLGIAEKIDEIITRHEKEIRMRDTEPIPELVEIREPSIRGPEMPTIRMEISPTGTLGELDQREEFFEIEPPTESSEQTDSWMLGDKETKKSFFGLARIKFGSKEKVPDKSQKINHVAKTKLEIEQTKREIEEKKRALEEAIRKEKEKETELKKKEEEKRKQEKLKKIELKKKMKEEKIKEKEEKKAQKELEKSKKKQEGIKLFGKKKETEETSPFIEEKKLPITEHTAWDEEVEELMPILDKLFDKLPENVIDEFANSKEFKLYEKVMLKYTK